MQNPSLRNGEACDHIWEDAIRCFNSHNICCACSDTRRPTLGFLKTASTRNGVWEVEYLFRWGSYCHGCRNHWTRRLEEAGPWETDFPRRLVSLMSNTDHLGGLNTAQPREGGTLRTQSTSTNTPPAPAVRLPAPPPAALSSPNAPPRTTGVSNVAGNTAAGLVTPTMSKSARKRAAKRARAAQERQRQQAEAARVHVTPASIPAPPALPSADDIMPSAFQTVTRRGSASQAPRSTWASLVESSRPSYIRRSAVEGSRTDEAENLRRLLRPEPEPVSRYDGFGWESSRAIRAPSSSGPRVVEPPERPNLGNHRWIPPSPGDPGSGWRLRIDYGSESFDRPLTYADLNDSDEEEIEEEEEEEEEEDEWEAWPALSQEPAATVRVPVSVTTQAPPPLSEEMRQLAEDTSVILELIGKTDPDDNAGMDSDYKQIIDDAFANISKIRTQYRVAIAKAGSVNLAQDTRRIADDEQKVDSTCIICCDEVSNTVLIPCNHLVLCMTCSDTMGIKGRYNPGPRTVSCPICRRVVLDRIKIFRG